MPRILVSGGTKCLGKDLVDLFGSDSKGLGRSNGFDISNLESRIQIAKMSLEYDLFFNHAHNGSVDGQIDLLLKVFELWRENKKSGHIFVSGSVATVRESKNYKRYSVIKYLQDQVCLHLAKRARDESLPFRITNLQLGKLSKDGLDGIRASDILPLINFIVENSISNSIEQVLIES